MQLRQIFAALATITLGCSSVAPDSEEVLLQEDELIGGRAALESEYQPTVYIQNGCTAAKVGPRHFLTAAHCVHDYYDNSYSTGYDAGSIFRVTTVNGPDSLGDPSAYVTMTIAATHVFPAWTEACARRITEGGDCYVNVLTNPEYPPDLAVVVVNEDSPAIPQATVDARPVTAGDPVVTMGYGCEIWGGSTPTRLKLDELSALPESSLVHEGAFISPEAAPLVAASNVITRGYGADPNAASLCPGDSGGPLYRGATSELLVVGVNAYYSFGGGASASLTNWHTRLDTEARYGVNTWLQELGVNMTTSGSTTSPCDGLCSNPTAVSSANFSSGNLGTGERCFETTASPTQLNCGNFASGRTFQVNGVTQICNGAPTTLPARRNGGYCYHASAGNHAWAWFGTW